MKLHNLFENFSNRLHKAETDSSDIDSELAAEQFDKNIQTPIDIKKFSNIIYNYLKEHNDNVYENNIASSFMSNDQSNALEAYVIKENLKNNRCFIQLCGDCNKDIQFYYKNDKIIFNICSNDLNSSGYGLQYIKDSYYELLKKFNNNIDLTYKNAMIVSKFIFKFLTGKQK